jgi:hypothetical protein
VRSAEYSTTVTENSLNVKSLGALRGPFFRFASHEAMMGFLYRSARHKWIALFVFQDVRNREVSPEASTDGFTASWKTDNDPRPKRQVGLSASHLQGPSGPCCFGLIRMSHRIHKPDAHGAHHKWIACLFAGACKPRMVCPQAPRTGSRRRGEQVTIHPVPENKCDPRH